MTQVSIHFFELPPAQADYRCGGCGLTWQRVKGRDMVQTSGYTHFFTRKRENDGYFHCCNRSFAWLKE